MKKINIFWLSLIIAFVFIQTRFLFKPGLHTFSDEVHTVNLHQMIRGFQTGQFPPRWAPDILYGHGHPLFNFYYPLPFYFGSLVNGILNLTLIGSLKTVFFVGVLLSGISFYLLGREFASPLISFTASILYLYTPYRAVDLYVRGAVGEIWAFAFMPLTLYAFVRLVRKLNLKSLIFAGFSLGGLILSHNLISFLFIPFLLIFITSYLLFYQNKFNFKRIKYSISAVLIGLIITTFYWLPALVEKKFVQFGTPYNPFDHFPFIKQLIIPYWGYGASVWGPDDQMSFQIGVINILVLVLVTGILCLKYKKIKRKVLFWITILGITGLSVFMMNIRSGFIWKTLPISEYIQFPWRFLLFTTLTSSFLTLLINHLPKVISRYLSLLLIFGSLILSFNYFQPNEIRKVSEDYYLNRYLTEDLDYLPSTKWMDERPKTSPAKKILIDEPAEILNVIRDNPVSYKIEYQSSEEVEAYFNSLYFPGWEAKVDQRQLDMKVDGPLGLMKLDLPPGKRELTIVFTDTPIRKWTEMISIVSSWLLTACYLLPTAKIWKKQEK